MWHCAGAKVLSSIPTTAGATILIKGISKRLDIKWPLATKWKSEAEAALACGVDGCLMPTWSNPTAVVAGGGGVAEASTAESRLRFRDVARGFGGSSKLLAKWGGEKVGRVVPTAVKAPLKRVAVRVAAKVAEARE